MVFDVLTSCPNFARLIGANELREIVEGNDRWPHPLKGICSRGGDAQDQYLAALDRAAELMEVVLARSSPRLRNKLAADLRQRSSYQAALSELMCGARLEALGADPVMEGDGGGPQPDFWSRLLGEPFYVEVYTPRSVPTDSLLDDIAFHLADFDEGCFVMLDVSRLPRLSKHAKVFAGRIKSLIRRMHEAGATEAIAYIPHGKRLEDCVTEVGRSHFSYPAGEPPEFFGRFQFDGIQRLRLTGLVDGEVVDEVRDARDELQELHQLRTGERNVLVVDLTGKHVQEHLIRAYETVSANVFARHPELSAILLTWRYFGLQPSPSVQQELRSGYRVIPAPNPALPMSAAVIEALKTRWLILRVRTES